MIPTDVVLTLDQAAQLIAFLVEQGHVQAAVEVATEVVLANLRTN